MPLEALLIPDNLTERDSDGIEGGTGCNFIFCIYLCIIYVLPVDGVLATPLDIFGSNFVCARTV